MKETGAAFVSTSVSDDPLSVLVIDDEPVVLGAAQMCLQRFGWVVRAVSDGRAGITLAQEFRPDVILCDAHMPGLSGPELIRELKADPATARLPVVLMSGLGRDEVFLNVPLAGFLQKPFGAAELRRAVEQAAGHGKPE